MLRPNQRTTRNLLELFVRPALTPPAHAVEWMTLVAQHCRTSLAPPPLPQSTLRSLKDRQLTVATGRHDCFLPPHRLTPAVRRTLDAPLTIIPNAGHFITDEQPDQILSLIDELRTGYTA